MPFATRVIETRTDINHVMNIHGANMLEKACVSNMVGLLQQLNHLSQHASGIFQELLQDATTSSNRISTVKHRIEKMQAEIPSIETNFMTNPPSYFYDNPYTGEQWYRKDEMRGFLFRRENAPKEVNNRRRKCHSPPDLSTFDAIAQDNKPCIKKFSDTDFFMDQWLKIEEEKMMEEKKKKRKRKEQRRKRKKVKRKNANKILKVQKKEYNRLGAEFKNETTEQEYIETRKFNIDTSNEESKSLPTDDKSQTQKSLGKEPTLPPLPNQYESSTLQNRNVPPPFNAAQALQNIDHQEEKEDNVITPSKKENYSQDKLQANMVISRNNLLAQIRSGKKLRTINSEKIVRKQPQDDRSKLLKTIQQNHNLKAKSQRAKLLESIQQKHKLKHINTNETQKPKREVKKQTGIFEILKRRQFIAENSSEDSGSDWGSEDE